MASSPVDYIVSRVTAAGAQLKLLSQTHMVRDEYQIEVLEDGARAIRVALPKLPADTFVARFTEHAASFGPAMLALSQGNPVGAPDDGAYAGVVEGHREYRFERTTAPFLLPAEVVGQMERRFELELGFADERLGGPLFLAHVGDDVVRLPIDGRELPMRAVHYGAHPGDPPASLTVIEGTPLVLSIARESWSTEIVEIWTPTRRPK